MLTILCMYNTCILCEVELAIFNILKFGTHFLFCNSFDKFTVQNNSIILTSVLKGGFLQYFVFGDPKTIWEKKTIEDSSYCTDFEPT